MTVSGKVKDCNGPMYAVILAGGIGSRFWPLSRETTPKQILKVVGDESLLKTTIRRLNPVIPPESVFVVTNARQAELIRLHLSYDGRAFSPGYIVEPVGKNTAPAIGLAALELYEKDPEAIMAVLPADHIIKDGKSFRDALKAAARVAREGHLVTFGIPPTAPETGYGYIKTGKEIAKKKFEGCTVRKVKRFVEKPDIKKAKEYLKDGGYYWNAGIFVWKAARILEEIKTHLPGVYRGLTAIRKGTDRASAYLKMDAVSIDHGILEKARDVVVIAAEFSWSDMGSWSSFGELIPSDGGGNIIKGRVVDLGSTNSIIFGCDRVVATIGLKDMIIVDTPDATLVCPRDRSQDVKSVVDVLRKKGFTEHESHKTVKRPWGTYTVLETGKGYKIKKICVGPGRRLSLQQHSRRSEHWVVIAGRAKVCKGDEILDVSVGESIDIPMGVKHRLENRGEGPLEIIEVQNGDYVGEDDILRFDDDFKRDCS